MRDPEPSRPRPAEFGVNRAGVERRAPGQLEHRVRQAVPPRVNGESFAKLPVGEHQHRRAVAGHLRGHHIVGQRA